MQEQQDSFEQFIPMEPNTEHAAYISPHAAIYGAVTLESDVSVWHCAVIRADIAPIHIGERSNVQDGAVLHVANDHPCIIGKEVTIGHGAIVHACTIEDGCLIGMGAIILDGAVIGEESIIAAGSLIPGGKKIPPKSLVMGSPGKVVRNLREDEIAHLHSQALKYVRLAKATRNRHDATKLPPHPSSC